jgi:hypothetical protein
MDSEYGLRTDLLLFGMATLTVYGTQFLQTFDPMMDT